MINFKNKYLDKFLKIWICSEYKNQSIRKLFKTVLFIIYNSYYLLSNHHINSQLTDHACFRNHVLILPFKRGRWRDTCQKIGTV